MKTETISAPGKKKLFFKRGGLHRSLGIKMGNKIPQHLISEALAGKHGEKAKKEALFMKNVLKK